MQLSELITTDKLNVLNSCVKRNEQIKRVYTHTPQWARDFVLQHIAPLTKRGIPEIFWGAMESAYCNSDNIVVIIDKNRIYAREIQYNKTHAYHIMRELKAGKRIYLFASSRAHLLSSKDAWDILTRSTTGYNYEYTEELCLKEECRIIRERRREKAFREAARTNRYVKAKKRGFNTQFNETYAYERCSAYQLHISTL